MRLMRSIWWLPIRVGIPLAMLACAAACWPQRGELFHLATSRLFYTAGSLVIVPLSRAVAMIIPAVALLVLLYVFQQRLTGVTGRRIRMVTAGALLIAVLVVACLHQYHLRAYNAVLDLMNLLLPPEYHTFLLLGLIGVGVLLAISRRRWTGTLRWLGRRLTRPGFIIMRLLLLAAGALSWPLLAGFAGVYLATGYFSLRASEMRAGKPDVILIMVDTLRADHLGCYGYARNTSPNIDRFARESTLFSTAIAQAPWTVWSVFSFMTSQYPDTTMIGMPRNPHDLLSGDPQHRRYPMLAEILKDRGYATHAVVSNAIFLEYPEFAAGYDDYDLSTTRLMEEPSSPAVTAAAIQRIKHMGSAASFLFLLYIDPHDPYLIHPGHVFTQNTTDARPTPISHAKNHTPHRPARSQAAAETIDAYDSEIAFTDAEVGKVLETLKAQGRYDDSLIILLADHGEELMEHGRLGHGETLYDEALRVPVLVKLPGQQQGAVVDGVFPLLDLLPSLLGALQIDTAGLGCLGDDVRFADLQRCADRPIFSTAINGLLSVRTSRSKYILQPDGSREQLYDLLPDPWEQHNLARARRQEAQGWQAALRRRHGPPPLVFHYLETRGTPFPTFTPEQLERLRALGYLN